MSLLKSSDNNPEQFIKYCCARGYLKKDSNDKIGKPTRDNDT
jgi:hypothetical protein